MNSDMCIHLCNCHLTQGIEHFQKVSSSFLWSKSSSCPLSHPKKRRMLFLPLFWHYRLILEKQLFYITYIYFLQVPSWFSLYVCFLNVWLWCIKYWVFFLLGDLWVSWSCIWYLSLLLGKFLVIMPSNISSASLFHFPFSSTPITCSLDHLIISCNFWMLFPLSRQYFFLFVFQFG